MINGFYVYQFHFVDCFEFLNFIASPKSEQYQYELKEVKQAFLLAGWEGDGEIIFVWIPPFATTLEDDNFGKMLWYVKQSNNGTSWIASREKLDMPKLEEVVIKESV